MLQLPETLTAREAPATVVRLKEVALQQQGGRWVLDASALKHFDSSAVAVLLECQRMARAAGKDLSIDRPPAQLLALTKLYGVEGLLADTAPAGQS